MKAVLPGGAVSLLAAAAGLSLLIGEAARGAEEVGVYRTLLEMVPSVAGRTVQIWINDYAAAAETLGIARPGADATDDDVLTYLLSLDKGGIPAGPFISGLHPYAQVVLPGLRESAGYDVRDVRASIQDLALIPGRRAAILLDLAGSSVREAILGSTGWPAPKQTEHRGVDLLVWDPVFRLDFDRRLEAPVFDELGRAAPLAFLGNGLLSASSVEDTEAMIDARLGLSSYLWDVDVIRNLAEGMARLGAYGCMLTDDPTSQCVGGLPPIGQAQLPEGADAGEALRPYVALGLGVGKDARGLYMALVLAHGDEAAAKENAALLPARLKSGRSLVGNAPWNAWFDVDAAVLEIAGTTLSARVPLLPTSSASVWVRWFLQRDPLLLFR